MHFARRHLNATLLPDGTVLVVGGGNTGNFDNPVTSAELFDPVTETWTVMAAQTAGRMYHSTAILLPDGRILSAGQNSGVYAKTGEIYSPPYLFKGARPTIASAPANLGYGQMFNVQSPDAASIRSVTLMRPGSVTHSINMDQRYVGMDFSVSGSTLTVTGPSSPNTAPPGWYMLFLVSQSGVPSIASWVHVA
jgi:hypothetical protein